MNLLFSLLVSVSLFIAQIASADEFQVKQGSHFTSWASDVGSACASVSWSSDPEFTCGQYSDWARCDDCNGGKNGYLTVVSRVSECPSYDLSGLCLEVCSDGHPVNIPELDIYDCDRLDLVQCPDESLMVNGSICPSQDIFNPIDYTCLDYISCFQEELSNNPTCIEYQYEYESPDEDSFTCVKHSEEFVQEPDGPTLEEHLEDMDLDFNNPYEDYTSTSSTAGDIAGAVQDSLHEDFSTLEHSVNNQTEQLSDGLSDIDSELETTNALLTQTNGLISSMISNNGDNGDDGDNGENGENLTSDYMDRIMASELISAATVSFDGFDSTCEPYEFSFSSDVSGHNLSVEETVDFHCTMLPEYSGILSFICLFASALFSIRVVLSA